MRLFIGLELPDAVRAHLGGTADRLRTAIGPAASRAIRWVDPGHLHVTLAFLGEVDDVRAQSVATALAAPLSGTPFTAVLVGAGTFPPAGRPRIIWAGLAAGADRIREMHRELYERLRPLGFEPDSRAYSPHVTLGRIKTIDGRSTRAVREALMVSPDAALAFRVDAATLFRSHTLPSGARYEPLLRVPLT